MQMMRVELTKFNKRFGIAKMAAKAYIGKDLCCEAELTCLAVYSWKAVCGCTHKPDRLCHCRAALMSINYSKAALLIMKPLDVDTMCTTFLES